MRSSRKGTPGPTAKPGTEGSKAKEPRVKSGQEAKAATVQKLIDNEHIDMTHDPKYKGAYDDRPLEPGTLAELNALVRDKPWDDERMEKVLDKLYDGCEAHAEEYSELQKEKESLRGRSVGRSSPKLKRQIGEVTKELDEQREWFKSFDRRVYLLHVQMAAQVARAEKDELIERYRFQAEVQRLDQESRTAFVKARAYRAAHAAAERGEIDLDDEFDDEVLRVLRESWKALKKIIKDARAIDPPALKNFEEGEDLAGFILEGKVVPEPPLEYENGAWINKLLAQLQDVRQKCALLQFKSVGGILRLQEQIAAKWKAAREPISAEVVDVDLIDAEVIDAEVIDAEVIDAEILPEPFPAAWPETPNAPAAFAGFAPSTAPAPNPSAPVALDLASAPPTAHANVFDFDAPARVPVAPPAPEPITGVVAAEVPANAVFSLDAAAHAPQRAKPAPLAPPVAAEDIFSLNAAPMNAPAPTPVVQTEPEPAEPKPAAGTRFGSGGSAALGIKPANGKRPAIRITMVKPGEKSPLAK